MEMKSESEVSRVLLLATPWTAAYQAPPSMGFSGKSPGVGCHCLLHINTTIYIIDNQQGLKCVAQGTLFNILQHPIWEKY